MRLRPIIGEWYQDLETRKEFEVVAIDSGTIEIQYYDGDLTEVDFENWQELLLQSIPAPEDWSGPFDEIEDEDMDDGETEANYPEHWANPVDNIDSYPVY